MGTDNLHHKRKAKKLKDQQRKQATRKPYDRVLIICEGKKTEPLYFEGLKQEYQLHTANIKITSALGSDPISLINTAKKLYTESKNEGNIFDKVYCVFDKDKHPNYDNAVNIIEKLKPNNTFFAITSVPCFEYWLLLHFEMNTKSYSATGKKSIADKVIDDLKKYIPDYEKNNKNIFALTKKDLLIAISNAEKANKMAEETNTDNPSTKVVDLVKYLINLKYQ
ncbi:RloB family protein [Lonepinella sp. BR2919]|uniref:RloB family protein n=1 Tax=unclassified Lonepinella TaxID=2642006 RepID=UPI003F6E31CC